MTCIVPEPTPEQAQTLLAAGADLVRAAVRGEQLQPPQLADMADWEVDGCFVSLHRGQELRSCCGMVNGPHQLADCLRRAAWRAACDDPRFAPISEPELSELNLEIHLLHGWQTCTAPADRRPQEIQVGIDGLVIRRHGAAGLLLPVVARDHGWDAQTFLEQCCRKAGLPITAWRGDTCSLDIFQAHFLSADLSTL